MSNSEGTVDLAKLGERIFGQRGFSQRSLTGLRDDGLAALHEFVQAQFNIAVSSGDTESVSSWSGWARAINEELTRRTAEHGGDPR